MLPSSSFLSLSSVVVGFGSPQFYISKATVHSQGECMCSLAATVHAQFACVLSSTCAWVTGPRIEFL